MDKIEFKVLVSNIHDLSDMLARLTKEPEYGLWTWNEMFYNLTNSLSEKLNEIDEDLIEREVGETS